MLILYDQGLWPSGHPDFQVSTLVWGRFLIGVYVWATYSVYSLSLEKYVNVIY